MAVLVLMIAAALVSGEPDGVIATAPATTVDLGATARPVAPSTEGATQEAVPHGLSTDAQIDRWIAARSTEEAPWSESSRAPVDDREMHGEVHAGIGTNGYRDFGAAVSLPLGENGRLALSFRQTENGYGYGYDGYDGYGYDALSSGPLRLDDGHGFPGFGRDKTWVDAGRAARPGWGAPRARAADVDSAGD
jgi:hypothetical protein